jgi:8-oxo-dGTP diphosphatase
MKIIEDKYNGITIAHDTLYPPEDQFKKKIESIIQTYTKKNLLWVKLPIERSELIPLLVSMDFEFHHCNERDITLLRKLTHDPIIPTSKNHTLGVGAVVRDNNNVLVIKDRFAKGYKLPGGHIDPNESITTALAREVYEETGVKVSFESITNLGHFTRSQFGESNLYIVCTAKALSKEINIIDKEEIMEARWIDIDEFVTLEDTNNYNKKIIDTVLKSDEPKLTRHELKLNVQSPYELFF